MNDLTEDERSLLTNNDTWDELFATVEKRCVDNWEPVYTEGKGSEWPNDTTARWLNHLADSYDGGVS